MPNRPQILKIVYIRKALVKLLITPPDDKGYIEGDIQSQEGDMQALQGDFDAKSSEIHGFYDRLQAGLSDFKAGCQKAIQSGYQPLPEQCAKADAYLDQYNKSYAATKAKFDSAASSMFGHQ